MKILHTADIHLREYEDDRWKTFQRLIEIGKQEEVKIVVISGDLFDKGIDAETLRPKIREIFSNNGFKIILIPGNHDSESYKSGMYFANSASQNFTNTENIRRKSVSYANKRHKINGA